MGAWQPLIEITILLLAALVLGTLAERLKQHAIIGYLIAGALVGPNVLGLVASGEDVELIAEIGVALLLFSIGLEFSFRRILRLGPLALVGGTLQVLVTGAVFAAVAFAMGFDAAASVAIGFMIAMSSTACVLRLLSDRAEIDSLHGRATVGVLLLQDVAVVPLMLLFSVLGGDGGVGGAAYMLGRAVVFGLLMVAGFIVLANYVIPRMLNLRQWARNRELPILLVIVTAIGASVISHELGLSPALGAFIAGVLLAESPFIVQVRSDVSGLRTVMVTLFFASIGMLADPAWIVAHWQVVLGVVLAIVVGKAAVVAVVMRSLRLPLGMAVAAGLCLAQVGEFSFVLAEIAFSGGVIDEEVFRLVVSATLITLLATAYMVRGAPPLAGRIERMVRRRGRVDPATPAADQPDKPDAAPAPGPIVIVGFGPAGQRVAESLLTDFKARLAVLDVNPRNASVAERYGLPVHTGDATHAEVLEHAGIAAAAAVIITLPHAAACRQVIELTRQLNGSASILCRARYHVTQWELLLAGAHVVVDEEDQVGARLAEHAREELKG